MRHRAAFRRLPQLLDDTLPGPLALRVQTHVMGCRACQQRLAEFEACERLVAQLPHRLIPLAASALDQHRLEGLARWGPAARRQRGRGPEAAALAVAAAGLAWFVALAGTASWLPEPDSGASAPVQVAYVLPGAWRGR